MDWLTYEFAKDFQSAVVGLIVGIVGFGGVILTLRANARLAREQHDRDRILAREQHERDLAIRTRVVRLGIFSELTSVHFVLSTNLKMLREALAKLPSEEAVAQQFPEISVSQKLILEIGLIDADVVAAVHRGILNTKSIDFVLKRHNAAEKKDEQYSIINLRRDGDHVLEMTKHAINTVDEALQKLSAEKLAEDRNGGAKT